MCSVAYTAAVAIMVGSVASVAVLRTHVSLAVNSIATAPPTYTDTADRANSTAPADSTHTLLDKLESLEIASDTMSESPMNASTVSIVGQPDLNDTTSAPGSPFSMAFPGLVTLTLVRETLSQFLLALGHAHDDPDPPNQEAADVTELDMGSRIATACHCPTCPLKSGCSRGRNDQALDRDVVPHHYENGMSKTGFGLDMRYGFGSRRLGSRLGRGAVTSRCLDIEAWDVPIRAHTTRTINYVYS